MYKKAHLISDFRKKVSPQLGLEPTNMRQNLKKSVSNMIECDVNVLSFGSDFSSEHYLTTVGRNFVEKKRKTI